MKNEKIVKIKLEDIYCPDGTKVGYCECGERLMSNEHIYCFKCGSKIDWTGEVKTELSDTQMVVFNALESLANAIMTIEEGEEAVKALSKEELQEVLNHFSKSITAFDLSDLYDTAFNYESVGNGLLSEIEAKLENSED
jgi:hypothetical protein